MVEQAVDIEGLHGALEMVSVITLVVMEVHKVNEHWSSRSGRCVEFVFVFVAFRL